MYDSCDDIPFHHLNFNCDPVHEWSHTPAEVSFWAASTTTTTKKMLMPYTEHCLVHRVEVVTSHAFKRG